MYKNVRVFDRNMKLPTVQFLLYCLTLLVVYEISNLETDMP